MSNRFAIAKERRSLTASGASKALNVGWEEIAVKKLLGTGSALEDSARSYFVCKSCCCKAHKCNS